MRSNKRNLADVFTQLWVRLKFFKAFFHIRMITVLAFLSLLGIQKRNSSIGPRILCITRPIFDEDVAALAAFSDSLNIISVDKGIFSSVFGWLIPIC